MRCALGLLFSFLLGIFVAQDRILSLAELCYFSSDIITAIPISTSSYQSEDKMHIYTKLIFRVTEKFKGRFNKNDLFDMKVYGGTVNGITKLVVGAPNYSVGEESLLFLKQKMSKRIAKVYFTLTGGLNGKYDIYFDEKDGVKRVKNESAVTIPRNDSKIELNYNTSLDQLITLVKTEISKNSNAQ